MNNLFCGKFYELLPYFRVLTPTSPPPSGGCQTLNRMFYFGFLPEANYYVDRCDVRK